MAHSKHTHISTRVAHLFTSPREQSQRMNSELRSIKVHGLGLPESICRGLGSFIRGLCSRFHIEVHPTDFLPDERRNNYPRSFRLSTCFSEWSPRRKQSGAGLSPPLLFPLGKRIVIILFLILITLYKTENVGLDQRKMLDTCWLSPAVSMEIDNR
jgi:hypothetical protein